MSTLIYPSAEFPGHPQVSIDVPDHWRPRQVPSAHIVMVEELPAGQFRPNVVVVVTRLGADQGLEGATSELVQRLAAAPGYQEESREGAPVDGRPAFRIQASWADAEVGRVHQTVTLVEVDHDGVRDLVQVTTSCAADQLPERGETLQAVQASTRIAA